MPKIFIIIILLMNFLTACGAANTVVEQVQTNLTEDVLNMLQSIQSYEANIEMHFISNRGVNIYEMIETETSIEIISPESLKGNTIALRENGNTILSNFLLMLEQIPKTVETVAETTEITLTVNISPYIHTQILTVENKELKSLISYDVNGEPRMKIFFSSINFY
ncbi:MAG: hypothetical protein FWF50_07345 [Defluviitaleaceae bacterium]|nr:hypothetical protein [Defluviitaleaceae bacterium]